MNQQILTLQSAVPRVPSVLDFILFTSIPVILGSYVVMIPDLLDLQPIDLALTFLFSLALTLFLRAPEAFEVGPLLHQFDAALQQHLFPDHALARDVRESVRHYQRLIHVVWANWMLSMTLFLVLQCGLVPAATFQQLSPKSHWLLLAAAVSYYVASILLYVFTLLIKGYMVRAVLVVSRQYAVQPAAD